MKGDGFDSFRLWKRSHENANAILNAASASDILGLEGYSTRAEVDRISALLEQRGMSRVRDNYSGDEKSFDSIEEAHFQYLALWFMHFAGQAFPHLIDLKRPIYAGLLQSRKRTPFMKPGGETGAFIGIPAGFLVAVDLFFRAHFRVRDLGKALELPAGTEQCVETDAIGGEGIERALRFEETKSRSVLLQLESGYIAFELFDPATSNEPSRGDPLDRLESNLLLETARVHHEFTGGRGEFSLLVPSPESRAAAYLCTMFAIFHEAGHELLAGFELEFAQAVGIDEPEPAIAIEAGIDLLAYSGYTAFINSISVDALQEPLVRSIIHPARFTLGASAFFAVAKATLIAEWIFRITQDNANGNGRTVQAGFKPRLTSLEKRNSALLGFMKRYFLAEDEGKIAQWHILALGAALEARCMEAAFSVMLDRFVGIDSTFCGKYRQ
jgi:hypothetical protein